MELLHTESDGRAPWHSTVLLCCLPHTLTYQIEGSGSSLQQLYNKLDVCFFPFVSWITKFKTPAYKKNYYSTLRQNNGAQFNIRMWEVSAVTADRWSSRAAARAVSKLGTACTFMYTPRLNFCTIWIFWTQKTASLKQSLLLLYWVCTLGTIFLQVVHGVVTSGRPWPRVCLLPSQSISYTTVRRAQFTAVGLDSENASCDSKATDEWRRPNLDFEDVSSYDSFTTQPTGNCQYPIISTLVGCRASRRTCHQVHRR